MDDDDKLREEIKALLSNGLKTEVFPRADTHDQVQEIVARAHSDHVSDRHFSAFIVDTNAVEVPRGRAIEEP